jgi:hypothetical protein
MLGVHKIPFLEFSPLVVFLHWTTISSGRSLT